MGRSRHGGSGSLSPLFRLGRQVRGGGGSRLARSAIVLLLIGLVGTLVASPVDRADLPTPVAPDGIEPLLDSVVAALHEGDYTVARQRVDAAYLISPSDPGVLWAHAFLLVWQGAYRLEEVAGDAAFAALLDAIHAHHERLKRGDPREGRAAYYYGLAALMRARTRIEKKDRKLFEAASDARRGVRSLERAVKLGYDAPDASFWTGAYRVMASSMPAAVRALRFLFGMPSTSRKRGLRELNRAMSEGRRFRLESSLLMADALSSERKHGYSPAVALLRTALPTLSAQGSILPHYAGEVLAEWGLNRQAISLWENILERQREQPHLYTDLEAANVRYDLGRLLVEEYRWAEAILHLRAVVEAPELEPARLQERARLLLAGCHHRMGNRLEVARLLEGFSGSEKTRRRMMELMVAIFPDPDVEREVARALEIWPIEGAAAALPELENLLTHHPAHVVTRYHAGRAAFELRRYERAQQHFQKLLDGHDESPLPEGLLGWAHLYLGWLAEVSGSRQEALEHYDRVRKLKGFDARRAGDLYKQLPYSRVPSRDADVWALLVESGSGEDGERGEGKR